MTNAYIIVANFSRGVYFRMVNENDFQQEQYPYYSFYPQESYMMPYHQPMMNEQSHYYPYETYMYTPYPYMNMQQQEAIAQDPSINNPVLQQFVDENGQMDINKMLKTVGQLADTVQQVTPVIRQLNDVIKNFRVK